MRMWRIFIWKKKIIYSYCISLIYYTQLYNIDVRKFNVWKWKSSFDKSWLYIVIFITGYTFRTICIRQKNKFHLSELMIKTFFQANFFAWEMFGVKTQYYCKYNFNISRFFTVVYSRIINVNRFLIRLLYLHNITPYII
jgi:hypothetical protein